MPHTYGHISFYNLSKQWTEIFCFFLVSEYGRKKKGEAFKENTTIMSEACLSKKAYKTQFTAPALSGGKNLIF